MNTYRLKQQGFILLEVMIASLIFAVAVLSIVSLQQQVLRASANTRNEYVAFNKIYDAMEVKLNKDFTNIMSNPETKVNVEPLPMDMDMDAECSVKKITIETDKPIPPIISYISSCDNNN